MSRYDVYALEGNSLVVNVQSDRLLGIATRVVIPLLPIAVSPSAIRRLNPVTSMDRQDYVLFPQPITSLRTQDLGRPIANLRYMSEDIVAAIDMVLFGF